jgi:hypothetical protein
MFVIWISFITLDGVSHTYSCAEKNFQKKIAKYPCFDKKEIIPVHIYQIETTVGSKNYAS